MIEHKSHIFVSECYDPIKDETFYRPLGGGIEFGELAKDAAVREFREELDTDISISDEFQIVENLFEFNGNPGHEIMFIFKAKFQDSSFYSATEFTGYENDTAFKALWVHIDEFTSRRKTLYPEGLI
ncbi:MutT/nudix family protein [Vibrio variabilis]|uniref:MutT/nudix family protein n=2 Tax=Vibrio TaxID=662 RepID=A0ABQ0J7M5_9VIBR|nr:MutT/nudix family protein [Vibrio variabilis]